ncbi:hypothetical protein [Thiolapillus sp.]|uniref:hypothetical protein n=1 Tax=Thiolapillus sp. TaxID=2017437 RepID=UPI003AF949DD
MEYALAPEGKQCGLAATGVYQPSLRSPWLAATVTCLLCISIHRFRFIFLDLDAFNKLCMSFLQIPQCLFTAYVVVQLVTDKV